MQSNTKCVFSANYRWFSFIFSFFEVLVWTAYIIYVYSIYLMEYNLPKTAF